ncbi:MAG TPA: hypothetical protein PKK26_14605, partial [Candidatus Wallbacteria bacterium]|nr:hypothetical protein [Candidatus Wallbacteria bacterium]
MREFIKKYNYVFLAVFIFTIMFFVGCTQSSNNSSSSVITWSDDGVEPNNPTWKIDTPYVVQKLTEQFYQVTLDWNPVTTNKYDQVKKNIVGYYIFRRREGGADKKIATTTDDNYVDKTSELIEGEKFIYTVVAFDNLLRQSATSAPQIIRLQPTTGSVPKPPANIFFAPSRQTVFGSDRGSIIVSWDPPKQNTDGATLDDLKEFEIERHSGNINEWQSIAKVPSGINVFSDSNLVMGVYYYRVRAIDKQGNYSQYVDGSYTLMGKVDNIPPGTPTNLIASGDAQVVLTWVKPEKDADGKSLDLAGFKIYRKRLDVDETYQLVKVLPPDTTWTDTEVNMDSYYQYTVASFDNSGNESRMSRPATNKVGIDFPDTPAGLTVRMQETLGQVKIVWQAVVGAVSYRIYRSEFSDGVYAQIGQPLSTEFTNSITVGKTYYYKVCAVNSTGREGSYTNYVTVSGDVAYRTMEAERYFLAIKKGTTATNTTPYKLEIRTLQFPFDADSYLFFAPLDDEHGESITGTPFPNVDAAACGTGTGDGDWFEFTQFLPNGAYNIDIWALRTGDSGTYKITVGGLDRGEFDFYTSGTVELAPFTTNINIANSLGTGLDVAFRFICMKK